MNLCKHEKINLQNLEELKGKNLFLDVASLHTGDSFGELALINDEPRKASIKTLSDCYLAYLDKNDYKKILRKI